MPLGAASLLQPLHCSHSHTQVANLSQQLEVAQAALATERRASASARRTAERNADAAAMALAAAHSAARDASEVEGARAAAKNEALKEEVGVPLSHT